MSEQRVFVISGRPTDEVFSYEEKLDPGEKGTPRCWHFNVSAMLRHVATKEGFAECIPLRDQPVPRAWIERHLIPQGLHEEKRVAQLIEPYLSTPVFLLQWFDGSVVLADGTHRMIRWFRDGRATHNALVFPKAIWPKFQLDIPGRGTLDVTHARVPDDHPIGDFLKRMGVK